jgi:hypothetical protein
MRCYKCLTESNRPLAQIHEFQNIIRFITVITAIPTRKEQKDYFKHLL